MLEFHGIHWIWCEHQKYLWLNKFNVIRQQHKYLLFAFFFTLLLLLLVAQQWYKYNIKSDAFIQACCSQTFAHEICDFSFSLFFIRLSVPLASISILAPVFSVYFAFVYLCENSISMEKMACTWLSCECVLNCRYDTITYSHYFIFHRIKNCIICV